MNFLKKNKYLFLAVLIISAFALFFMNNQVLASSLLEQVGEQDGVPKGELTSIIANFIKIALNLVGIILIGLILFAGFKWMTAGGDGGEVTKAKDMLRNAIIGLIIIVLAYAIATFVTSKLTEGVSGTSGSTGAYVNYQLLNILK